MNVCRCFVVLSLTSMQRILLHAGSDENNSEYEHLSDVDEGTASRI